MFLDSSSEEPWNLVLPGLLAMPSYLCSETGSYPYSSLPSSGEQNWQIWAFPLEPINHPGIGVVL